MSLGGEGPLTRQIRALSHGEKGPKPKANVLQIGPNFAGGAHAVLEAYRTKGWAEAAPLGCGRTTSALAPL